MSSFTNFKRIVLFQRRNGWVCDVGAGRSMMPSFDESREYFGAGSGVNQSIGANRSMTIPVFDEESIAHLKKMERQGCELRCIAIGDKASIVWEMDSAINVVERQGGLGSLSGANVVLFNSVHKGSIYRSSDLLSGIPYECETAVEIGGTYYLPGPSGFQGNRYVGTSGDTVDENGAATIGGTYLTLNMHFPLEGAVIKFGGNWTGVVRTQDFSGSNITSNAKGVAGTDLELTVDSGTWKLQVDVSTSTTRPTMEVVSAGDLHEPRVGGCIDCDDLSATLSTAPSWTS